MKSSASDLKKYPTIAVCGLDCGMCPRFYTAGPSRCPGCGGPDFPNKHPSCSFITCCVKKRQLETCGECPDFPCSKFKTDKEYQQTEGSSSYPSEKKRMPNLNYIKEQGIVPFIKRQKERIKLLEKMLKDFDDGRSKSYYCRAACLLDADVLKNAMKNADAKIRDEKIKQNDLKGKAKILKILLDGCL
ncbi:MAG: DUF3795 domain-containing protein [Spirochaetales bacterium]|nr:DUF3795 domain-containing protein [Spirochaetales bacterium]